MKKSRRNLPQGSSWTSGLGRFEPSLSLSRERLERHARSFGFFRPLTDRFPHVGRLGGNSRETSLSTLERVGEASRLSRESASHFWGRPRRDPQRLPARRHALRHRATRRCCELCDQSQSRLLGGSPFPERAVRRHFSFRTYTNAPSPFLHGEDLFILNHFFFFSDGRRAWWTRKARAAARRRLFPILREFRRGLRGVDLSVWTRKGSSPPTRTCPAALQSTLNMCV